MANKEGVTVPGMQQWYGRCISPQLTALLTTANAGGAAVSAAYLGLTTVDDPLKGDFRMIVVRGDKAFTGSLLFTPRVDGSSVGTAPNGLGFTVAAQGGAFKIDNPVNPGTSTIDHGNLVGWDVTANGAFTCTGTLSLVLHMFVASAVQPTKGAWAP